MTVEEEEVCSATIDLPVYIPSTEFPTRIMIANAMNVTVYSTARVC